MHTDVIGLVYDSVRPRDNFEQDNLAIEAWNETLIFGSLVVVKR